MVAAVGFKSLESSDTNQLFSKMSSDDRSINGDEMLTQEVDEEITFRFPVYFI
jgi:hypothetical protein